ncbi:hypothetical protein CRV24_007767 [Beauveria bassiana]|nr:hypothetical protein CRV24_007767 [Beauveria bassiana]
MEMSWGRRPDPALNKPFTTKSRREGSSEARMGQPRRHCGASQVPQSVDGQLSYFQSKISPAATIALALPDVALAHHHLLGRFRTMRVLKPPCAPGPSSTNQQRL